MLWTHFSVLAFYSNFTWKCFPWSHRYSKYVMNNYNFVISGPLIFLSFGYRLHFYSSIASAESLFTISSWMKRWILFVSSLWLQTISCLLIPCWNLTHFCRAIGATSTVSSHTHTLFTSHSIACTHTLSSLFHAFSLPLVHSHSLSFFSFHLTTFSCGSKLQNKSNKSSSKSLLHRGNTRLSVLALLPGVSSCVLASKKFF